MNVTIESSGNLMIAYLIGELDHHSAGEIRVKIDAAVSCKKPNHLILDFKNVSFMDSSGIGLIMGRYKLMDSMGGSVRVEHASPQLKKIMNLAGLSLLPIAIR